MFAREGLEGVVAARTSICLIGGADARLEYRGYSIEDLAEQACFEEVVYLLWYGELPTAEELSDFSDRLKENRNRADRVLDALGGELAAMPSIDALRTVVSMLAAGDSDASDNSQAANLRKGARLVAAIPAIVAAHIRSTKDLERNVPRPDLGHAANLLHLAGQKPPREIEARAFEVAMILQADHGLNASTFAARVTAGTLADLHAAIVAALAAMKGPLHGGAAGEVMRMMAEVGAGRRAAAFVQKALRERTRIPGFGHRIYKAADPRATILKRWCERLAKAGNAGAGKWFEIANAIERQVHKRKALYPNVDLYAAALWSMLGFAPDTFASLFACARIAGWVAHVTEQHLDNRLIRPTEEYIGPLSRPFVPLEDRG